MLRCSFALLVLLSSCARFQTPERAVPVPRGYQRTIIDHSAAKSQISDGPIAEVPRVLDVLLRVRPDRRFVNAAADVVELSKGRKIDNVDIEFLNGAWDVRVNDEKAVTFGELPAYHDALRALSEWVRQQHAASTSVPAAVLDSVDAEIASFRPRFLFHAVQQLDAAAKGKPLDAAGSARAAKAAALLLSQSYDDFDLADPLRGRALALLAIAKSLDAACCTDTEALIASELGYESEANQLAAGLPNGYVKSRITGGEPGAAHGVAEDALVLARRLQTEVLSPASVKQKQFRGTLDIEAGPYLLANSWSGNEWPFGQIIQSMMLRSMDADAPQTISFADEKAWRELAAADPSDLLRRFESRIPGFAASRASRLLDSRSVLAFYDANWYAALHQPFAHLALQQGSAEGAASFVNSLHPVTATGQQVVAWMSRYVAAEFARGGYFEKGGPPALDLIGGTLKYQLFNRIRMAAGGNSLEVHRGARDLFPAFDSRPGETYAAGQLAEFPLGHIPRRDLYLKSVFDRAPQRFAGERVEYLNSIGAKNGLRALAADRKASPADRMAALGRLGQLSDEDLHAAYEQVFIDTGYHGGCLSCYFAYANKHKEPKLKERIARTYLERNRNLGAIEEAFVISAIANALEAQGRYREAWTLVEPRVRVFSANILLSAVSLLQRLGRDRESIQLGQQMIERYPTADMYGDFARVLWRMHRYDEAADLFNPAKHTYSIDLLDQEGPADFLESFTDAETAQAVVAFDALIKAKAPAQFLSIVIGAALKEHRPALSFALNERFQAMPASGYDQSMQIAALQTGYDALREVKGPDEAMKWYLQRIPANKAGSEEVLISLLDNRKFDLVSAMVAAHRPAGNPVDIASLVAIALTLGRVPVSDARWNVVRSLMPATAPGDGKTMFAAVRYLMREADESEVYATVSNATDRTEAPFFIAIRAVGDGDYDKALGGFLAGAEGPPGYPTTSMSLTRLWTWRSALRPWVEIKRERIF